jgi:peptide chain release factor 2
LEGEMQQPDFWKDQKRAVEATKELSEIQQEISDFTAIKTEEDLRKMELRVFLSGKYNQGNAILSVYAGAGGQDAQDWATMLLRMYERYAAFKGFKTKILHQSFGEAGGPEGRIGTKQATLEIRGKYAYGFLKKESGVHRLVRISPFSTQKLRHTSFVLVEVLPEIKIEESEIKIRPEDLKVDFYRASGPGGQYVNKRETSVRITHLPTGLTVSCQSERLQGENRKRAQGLLLSKLYQIREEEQKKEISKIKNKKVSIEWGNQIRSYVLHPYKLVKDLRTNIETSRVEEVLDGKLDEFIEVEIKENKL